MNRPVQSQKTARRLKFWILEEDKLYCLAKTKALISCALTTQPLTTQLICVFVFALAKIRFSHDAAHIICNAV